MGRNNDEQLLVRTRAMMLSGDWSNRDTSFVYVSSDPATRLDIWIKPPTGDARAFLNTPSNEMQPRLSRRPMDRLHLRRGRKLGGLRPIVSSWRGQAGDINEYRNHYAATSDGQRFLLDTADESTREPITVVVNWDALLGR